MTSDKKRVILSGPVHVTDNILDLTFNNHSKYASLFLKELTASKQNKQLCLRKAYFPVHISFYVTGLAELQINNYGI
jgi:hypothetical protein